MNGLVKRGGVWQYRRMVPPRLRSVINASEVKRSLGTGNLQAAQRRWSAVKAEVDRMFAEAEAAVKNPSIAAYKAVEEWRRLRAKRPAEDDEEDALDEAISTLLQRGLPRDEEERILDNNLPELVERDAKGRPLRPLDAHQRAVLEGLLRRRADDGADNPPLSVLFDRYNAERKLPPKTNLEWDSVLRRFTATVGADLPVRAITPTHVRSFKTTLLATTGRTGKTLSPATVKKTLGALSSVLSWAKREGYLTVNPAEGITAIAKGDPEAGRLPYNTDDLKAIFNGSTIETRRRAGIAYHWLPWLSLYTGARLEELGQLRTADVREEEGIDFLAIEAGNGKRIKTRSSRRRIPIHPELQRMGFLDFVERQRAAGHVRLFPELKATRLGSVTAAWSKWWGHHARNVCGVTDRRKVFHSLRHGWKDAARAVMPEEHHDAITGHANGSVGRNYGTGVPLKVLAESMAKVAFVGLDSSKR